MVGFGWIPHTIPFMWPWIMTSVSTEKFDFNKNWKTKKQHNQNTSYHQKTFYMNIHQGKTQKRQNKSIKTWCLRSFVYFVVCVWCSCFVFGFSFCILGFKLLVFLFAMLLHFSWFNYFSKMLLGLKPFFITKSIKTNSW